VYAVIRPGGTDAVLKLPATLAEARVEGAALRAWAGEGAVALLDSDGDTGALLLERLRPGTPLPRGGEGSVEIAAATLAALHRASYDGGAFRTLAGTFPDHEREVRDDLAHERRARGEPERALAAERALPAAGLLMERLAGDDSRRVLLHGDFLTKNLLLGADGYRAIDPLPRIGDPCADAAMFASGQPAAAVLDTAAALASSLALDVDRTVAWAVVWTVMVTVQAWRSDQAELDLLVESPTFRGVLAS
jgi:streptomycin 6-kinase